MNTVLALVIFLVVACILWAVAELRYKNFDYVEDEAHHDPTAEHGDGPYVEKNIRDIMKENSTKGFSAI